MEPIVLVPVGPAIGTLYLRTAGGVSWRHFEGETPTRIGRGEDAPAYRLLRGPSPTVPNVSPRSQ
jgi:hypothetical protein